MRMSARDPGHAGPGTARLKPLRARLRHARSALGPLGGLPAWGSPAATAPAEEALRAAAREETVRAIRSGRMALLGIVLVAAAACAALALAIGQLGSPPVVVGPYRAPGADQTDQLARSVD